MSGISMAELHVEVIALLDDGDVLDELSLSLVRLAAVASPTTLDLTRTAAAVDSALDAGATPAQLQEVLVLVSCIGMHTLIGSAGLLAEAVRRRDDDGLDAALGEEAALLAEGLLGGQGRETRIAEIAPDFWPNLLRLSPYETVRAVADFRAAPWAGGSLTDLQRELIGVVVDSVPTHRFLPTLRIHVRQAVMVGAGGRALRQVLDVAASTTLHPGVR